MGRSSLPSGLNGTVRRGALLGLTTCLTVGLSAGLTASAGAVPSGAAFGMSAVGVSSNIPADVPARTDDPAASKRKIDEAIRQLKEQLGETSTDLAAAYLALNRTQAKLPAAQSALASAQARAASASDAYDAATVAVQVAQANEAKIEDALKDTRTTISTTRTKVAQFAAQIYQDQGYGDFDLTMSATSPQDFADRLALVDTVMDVQGSSVDQLAAAQADQVSLEARLQALREESVKAKAVAAAALATANAARNAAAAAKADLESLIASQASAAASVKDKLTAERARLATMQTEQARLQAVLKARAIAAAKARAAAAAKRARERAEAIRKGRRPPPLIAPPPNVGGGYLSSPLSVFSVGSEFGMRFHPILHYWRLHAGMDLSASCGTPVYAAAPGTIISAGMTGGSGNRIVIAHGYINGVDLATTYNHLSAFVRTSGSVSRGQLIGRVGTTGLSTGCHLHFETYENGTPVNPRRWL